MFMSGARFAGLTGLLCLWLFSCAGEQANRGLRAYGRPIMYGTPDTSPEHQAVVFLDLGWSACTGTLIANNVVLTAAHCLAWVGSVDVGFGNTEGSLDYYGSTETWAHPDFSFSNLGNDIGLVRIEGQPAGVTPIPFLPSSLEITQSDENNLDLEFVGFGVTETNSYGTKMTVTDVLEWVCTSPGGCDLGGGAFAEDNTICYDQVPGGPCSGDSGGPAFVWRGGVEYVGGITSYGDENCVQFGCSTKVDAFQQEIVDFMGGENGAPCTGAADCDSGFCVDGVCCESACAGECQVCNLAPAGTCQTAPNGTPCPDADLCDGEETCQSGSCQPSAPLNCDDQNPCTSDSCSPAEGCLHNPVQNGISCADTNVCNGEEYCLDGVCLADEFLDCDDGNPCTEDTCDVTSGCSSQNVSEGTPCPNDNLCDGAEVCIMGNCQTGATLDCDDQNICTTDQCDPVAGCQHPPAPSQTACEDGNLCTGGDFCQAGLCTQGSPVDCGDGNLCTQDSCDALSGCQYEALPDGTNCGGGMCAEASCSQGECVSNDPDACQDDDPCTLDWCDPARGCVFDPAPDGHECGECMMCVESVCVEEPDCEVSDGCGCGARPAESALVFLGLVFLGLWRRRG
jgi:uncharacterized protein (TIGR03382 family)